MPIWSCVVFEGEFGAYLELCGILRRVWCLFGVVWYFKENLVPIWTFAVFERRVWCLSGVVWSLKESSSLVPIWSCAVFERRVWCLFGVAWSLKESLVPIWSCLL